MRRVGIRTITIRTITTRTIATAATVMALTGCALLATAGMAWATGETVSITEASFSPAGLGMPTNAFGRATIGASSSIPSPITHVNVLGPAGTTLNLQGSATCSATTLEREGPKGCPVNSKAGMGGGEGVYELGGQVIEEEYKLDFFLSDNQPGHVALAVFLLGSTPVSIEMVFAANVITAPKPYGLGFSLNVPLIKVLPEASDASAKSAYITLGAKGMTYYKTVHGKRKLEHIKGIITPKTCPRGGWPVASEFTFQDGTEVTAKRTIPCSKK